MVPLEPGGKRPILKDWVEKATSDASVIAEWAERWPNANAGAVMGDGLFALDVDPKNGGDRTLAALLVKHGPLPQTVQQRTPSGGTHYVFKSASAITNSAGKLGKGLDIRGEGGQIVVSPSSTPAGFYRWVPGHEPWKMEPAEAPAWLIAGLTRPRLVLIAKEREAFPPVSPADIAAASLALEAHGAAIEGSGGDEHTMIAARILANDFALSESEAWPLLWQWNADCSPPWTDEDLIAKLRNALGAEDCAKPYGCRRQVDALAAVRAEMTAWRALTQAQADAAYVPMLQRVREIARGVDPALRGQILRELEGSGVSKKEASLPPGVDPVKAAELNERRAALASGDQQLIDSKDPLNTAKRFLAARADVDGLPELVRWQEAFWRAEGTRYAERGDEQINADLYGFAEGKREVASNAPLKPDRNIVETIVHALRAAALLDVKSVPAWIDGPREHAAEDILAFKNGLLHIPTRGWIPATRAFFGLNAVDFDYDASAPHPVAWQRFLDQLWPGDAESIETLQEIFGLALTGDTSFQKLFLLIGPKRGGKGNIARVLTAMVGLDNVTAPTLNGLGQHFGLESLISKTLAVISDARLGGRADLGAVVENLLRISGEDTISVPRKHRSDWTAKLRLLFLIISNELPNFLDQSGALASRFIVLRLTRSFFGNEDRGLTQRLLQELPGILLWSLQGLDRLRERGHFRQPVSALEMVKQLETLASPIKAFIADRCVIVPGASVPCSDLFAAWSFWSTEQGRDHVGTVQMLGRNLTAAFPEITVTQPRVNGGRVRHYEGIKLALDGTRGDPLQLSQEIEKEEVDQ